LIWHLAQVLDATRRKLQRKEPLAKNAILGSRGESMSAAKHDVELLLRRLPDTCSLEDIQYHLYVLEKVRRGLDDAHEHGTISQEDAEARLRKWLTE
jgi:hypothetical protein